MLIWKCGPLLSVRRFNLGFPPLSRLNRAVLANLWTWRLHFRLYWSWPLGRYMFLWVWCVQVCICSWMCAYMHVGACICDEAGGQCRRLSSVILPFNFRDKVFHWAWARWFALPGEPADIRPSPPLQCWGYRQMQPHPAFYGSAGDLNSGSRHFVGNFGTTELIPQHQINYFYFSTPTVQVLRILGNIRDITLGDSVYRWGDAALWWK